MQAKRKMPIGLAGLLTLGLIGVLCFHPAAAQAQSISETFSTSGSWKAPEGVTLIKVEAWGGGGGTGAPANNARRGGGGGGAYSEKAFCVTPGETYSFVVGTGGAATGGNGGDTYWVDPQTLIAKGGFGASGSSGGAGGAASDAEYISYGGGNGASSTGSASGGGGGGAGSCGAGINASGCTGGGATDEHGGKGGNGVDSEGRGKNGSNYGGGGGGSWRYGDTGNAGTTGACGLIRITYVLSALPKITAHPDSQAITYGENAEFSAAATGNPVPAVQWQLNKGDGWSDIPGETNATLKLIKPGVADSGSYRAVFRNTEGSAYSDTAALIVSKATAQVTLYGLNQTFDGSDKEAAADTYPGGLLVVFSYDGSPVVPMGAGTYAVTAKIVDDNYQGNATGDLVIKKADADIHVSGVTATYDGCAHGACGTAAGADGKDLSGLLSFGALFTDAPGGTANWHFAGDKNHNAASGIVDIIIKKADADISVSGVTATYDGCAHGACGTAAGADGKDLSGLLSFGALFTDAPGGTANWHFAGDKNHNAASGIVDIIIKKADADISVSGVTATYDGCAHGACGTAAGADGKDLSGLLSFGALFTDAPGGTANWHFAGDKNHNAASGIADIIIKKADADISVSGVTATYDGCAHGACGTAAGADGKDLSGLLSLGALFTDAPGGTANWHFAGDKNHNAASGIAEVIIKKADADIVLKNLRQTYDGQKKTVTAETNPAGLAVVFTYGGSETAPRSIGRYRVVGTAEDNNYQGSVTGTLIIFDETATTFTLSVSVIGQGTTGLRTGVYEEGDVILLNALSAVPAEGFEFVGWQDVKGHMLKSVTISADTEIFAVFSKVIDVIPIEDIPAVANTGVKGAVSKGTVPASKPWPASADASDGWLWWLLLAVPFGLGLWLLLFLAIKRKGSSIGIET